MSVQLRRAASALAGAIVLVITGCGPGGGEDVSGAPEATPASVIVTADVAFATEAPNVVAWQPPVMDIYAPASADGGPLVVILPPHGVTPSSGPAIQQLARALAGSGAVAVVAGWSQEEDPEAEFSDIAVLTPIAVAGLSTARCAVEFAAAHAREWGADPDRLVTVGALYGGNDAGTIALGSVAPLAGCAATADVRAAGTVMWDPDLLAAMPPWDGLGADAARAVDLLSPWHLLTEGSTTSVTIAVTAEVLPLVARCDGRDAPWLVQRDPDGAIRAQLDAVDAFADDCVDPAEIAAAAVAVASGAGTTASAVTLENADGRSEVTAGAYTKSLGGSDLQQLVTVVLDAAD